MNTKHTPGPWAVNHETDITGTENDPQNGCMGPVDVAPCACGRGPHRPAPFSLSPVYSPFLFSLSLV